MSRAHYPLRFDPLFLFRVVSQPALLYSFISRCFADYTYICAVKRCASAHIISANSEPVRSVLCKTCFSECSCAVVGYLCSTHPLTVLIHFNNVPLSGGVLVPVYSQCVLGSTAYLNTCHHRRICPCGDFGTVIAVMRDSSAHLIGSYSELINC